MLKKPQRKSYLLSYRPATINQIGRSHSVGRNYYRSHPKEKEKWQRSTHRRRDQEITNSSVESKPAKCPSQVEASVLKVCLLNIVGQSKSAKNTNFEHRHVSQKP